MADRYTYVPLLGIFTLLVWTGAEFATRHAALRVPCVITAAFVLGASLLLTRQQVLVWENSVRLHRHSITAGEDNATTRYLFAMALQQTGRPEPEVTEQLQRVLQLQSDYVNAYTQLGLIALIHQRLPEARQLSEMALSLDPLNAGLQENVGFLCLQENQIDEAVAHFRESLRLNPAAAKVHRQLASIFFRQNRFDDARAELETAMRVAPWDWEAANELGAVLANSQHYAEARRFLEKSLWINPSFKQARDNLSALSQLERTKP